MLHVFGTGTTVALGLGLDDKRTASISGVWLEAQAIVENVQVVRAEQQAIPRSGRGRRGRAGYVEKVRDTGAK